MRMMVTVSFFWITFSLIVHSTSSLTIQKLACPKEPNVTWDYLQVVTVKLLKYGSPVASVCVQCKDYYATNQVDKSSSICLKMRFQTRHLKNILKITPSFDTLSNVYTFRCTEQTLKEFLTSDDISTGEVCESYISQGNAEVVILYESPNDATTMTTDTTETHYLFGIDWSSIWMRTAITFLIFNLILCLILGTVVGSYYRKRKLRELWTISTELPKYFLERTRLHVYLASMVSNEVENPETYIAHDMAVRSLSISQLNESTAKFEDRDTRVGVDLEGVQIVNYTQQQPKEVTLLSD